MNKNTRTNNVKKEKIFFKTPLITIFLIVLLLSLLIMFTFLIIKNKNLVKQSTETQLKQIKQSEIKRQEVQDISDDGKLLKYFLEDILPQHQDLQDEFNDFVVRRVTAVEGSWIIEIFDPQLHKNYKPDLTNTRSVAENRDFYLLTSTFWKKLTETPIPCYVDQARLINKKIPVYYPNLEDSLFIISGLCNNTQFTSLYKESTGEKIQFTDPTNLISTKVPKTHTWITSRIIDKNGNAGGILEEGVHGKEPVIVVKYGQFDGINPPYGIGIFSLQNGNLLDLLIYDNF
jgi:hypothetical protein